MYFCIEQDIKGKIYAFIFVFLIYTHDKFISEGLFVSGTFILTMKSHAMESVCDIGYVKTYATFSYGKERARSVERNPKFLLNLTLICDPFSKSMCVCVSVCAFFSLCSYFSLLIVFVGTM